MRKLTESLNNNNIFFTSDWHLGENRPHLFFREIESVDKHDENIVGCLERSGFKDGDKLYHLGDFFYNPTPHNIQLIKDVKEKYPHSKFILIAGNYDKDEYLEYLNILFDAIYEDTVVKGFDFGCAYLNHYPTKTKKNIGDCQVGITGHIHSLWKVQRRMINVGLDAWHMKLVPKDKIEFIYDAMQNHYDDNVFPY